MNEQLDKPSTNMPPQDLCQQAVKVARRLQALPVGKAYDIMLIKWPDEWSLIINTGDGVKVEKIRA